MLLPRSSVLLIKGGRFARELIRRAIILHVTDARCSQKASREDACRAHGPKRQGTALGKPFRDYSQHGWPKECLAHTVDRRGQEYSEADRRVSQPEQSN